MIYYNISIAIAMGAAMAVYFPMISLSARILGAPIMGNVPFFAVALICSLIISRMSGIRYTEYSKLADVPAWLFLAGAISAFMITGTSYLVPRIGTGALFVSLVTGQILFGLVINHFGMLNVPVQPFTLVKAAGALLVILGAAIIMFADGSQSAPD